MLSFHVQLVAEYQTFLKDVKMAFSATIRNASPFLKWVGGKTQLLPALLDYVPAHFNTYIEPFVGGHYFSHHQTTHQLALWEANKVSSLLSGAR